MIDALLLAVAIDTSVVRDKWIAEDKLKHAGMSYAITSFSYAATNDTKISVGAAITAGLLKELYDRRHGRPFSARDLFWDVLGVAAGYAMIKQAR